MTLETLVLIAGVLHFALLPASLSVPKVLRWKEQLSMLTPLCRQVIWVHGVFVAAMIVAFGALTLALADRIAAGKEPVLTALMGGFWLLRLVFQLAYLDPRDWPSGWWVMPARYALTTLFAFWSAVYFAVFFGVCL
jgi:hypothetical protein